MRTVPLLVIFILLYRRPRRTHNLPRLTLAFLHLIPTLNFNLFRIPRIRRQPRRRFMYNKRLRYVILVKRFPRRKKSFPLLLITLLHLRLYRKRIPQRRRVLRRLRRRLRLLLRLRLLRRRLRFLRLRLLRRRRRLVLLYPLRFLRRRIVIHFRLYLSITLTLPSLTVLYFFKYRILVTRRMNRTRLHLFA